MELEVSKDDIHNKINNSTPWVEKYRPSNFDDIVLDDVNKKIIESVI